MKETDALIRQLECATKGSRGFDGDIWAIADYDEMWRRCGWKGLWYAGHLHTKAEKAERIKRMAAHLAPAYTTSLDAALTLVPDGMGWGVKKQQNGHFAWCDGDIAQAGNVAVRYGVTPAIALCIAALKARQAAK